MKSPPSTNGSNGERDARGRFATGNSGGPGNPHAKKVAHLRTLILEAVTEDDLRVIVEGLVQRAREGDLAAAREILNRLVGSPADATDRRETEARRAAVVEQQLDLSRRRVEVQEDRLFPIG